MASKLVGRKIVAVRKLTEAEMERQCWDRSPVVLVLDDGTILYPSRGVLFGRKGKEEFALTLP